MAKFKKAISFILVSVLMVSATTVFTACSKGSDKLIIWTFTDELKEMVENYYKVEYPDADISVETIEVNGLVTKMDNALDVGKNLPDIIALEEKIMRHYIDLDIFESLQSIVGTSTSNMYQYTLDMAKDGNDNVVALAWQATPGAVYYRTDMAKDILGIETPEEMQDAFDSWEAVLETARLLFEGTGAGSANVENYPDKVKVFSALAAPAKIFYSQRELGWITDNKLTIDPTLYDSETTGKMSMFDVYRALQAGYTPQKPDGGLEVSDEDSYVNQGVEWQSSWYADMAGDEVFSFPLPSYAIHFNLKENCTSTDGKSTFGKWGVIAGPGLYSDGGTWLAVLQSSSKKEEAKRLIEYFTTNEDFLAGWASEKGDFMNNKPLMNSLKGDAHSEEILGGQNQYDVLCDIAEQLRGNNLSRVDQDLNEAFSEIAVKYAKGQSVTASINSFKATVGQLYPSLAQ